MKATIEALVEEKKRAQIANDRAEAEARKAAAEAHKSRIIQGLYERPAEEFYEIVSSLGWQMGQ